MSSFAKACVDLSNNIRNFRFSKSNSQPPASASAAAAAATIVSKPESSSIGTSLTQPQLLLPPAPSPQQSIIQPSITNSSPVSPKGSPTISRGTTVAAIKQRLFNQGLKIEISPKKKKKTRYKDYAKEHFAKRSFSQDSKLWLSKDFLLRFFTYFTVKDLCSFCLVCRYWNSIIYSKRFWDRIKLVINLKLYPDADLGEKFREICRTIHFRRITYCVLEHASDRQISIFLDEISKSEVDNVISHISIRCSSITDRMLQKVTEIFVNLMNLEIFCCNDLSEVCLWSALVPNISVLTLWDCINISDESLGAVTQLLPNLTEFNLQAYHVTDMALTYFNTRHLTNLKTLQIVQCMDITNQGVVNIAHSLPNITNLSLSGLSKLTDDGLDVICESMKQLVVLNISWCPKLTDSGLECVACDLTMLEELILDR